MSDLIVVKGLVNFPLILGDQKIKDGLSLVFSPKTIYVGDPILGIFAEADWLELESFLPKKNSPYHEIVIGEKYYPLHSFVRRQCGSPVVVTLLWRGKKSVLIVDKNLNPLPFSVDG